MASRGLKPGDRWWPVRRTLEEALAARQRPAVVLEATHAVTLQIVPLDELKKYAVKLQMNW